MTLSSDRGISLKSALFTQWLTVSLAEDKRQVAFSSACVILRGVLLTCLLLFFSFPLHLLLCCGGQLWNLPGSAHFLLTNLNYI